MFAADTCMVLTAYCNFQWRSCCLKPVLEQILQQTNPWWYFMVRQSINRIPGLIAKGMYFDFQSEVGPEKCKVLFVKRKPHDLWKALAIIFLPIAQIPSCKCQWSWCRGACAPIPWFYWKVNLLSASKISLVVLVFFFSISGIRSRNKSVQSNMKHDFDKFTNW